MHHRKALTLPTKLSDLRGHLRAILPFKHLNVLQVAVLSLITGAFFWRHRLHQDTLADGQTYAGLLCKHFLTFISEERLYS